MSIDSAFRQFPILTTERLVLRPVSLEDVEAYFAFKSDYKVTHPYGQEPHETSAKTQAWVERLIGGYEKRDNICWSITLKGDDRAIGETVLWNFDENFHCAELGYELHSDYWRKGIVFEAVQAVLRCAFTELSLHRVEATPYAENPSSKNLLVRLGFSYEGTLRQRHVFRGRYLDQLYFGLLKEEWERAQNQ